MKHNFITGVFQRIFYCMQKWIKSDVVMVYFPSFYHWFKSIFEVTKNIKNSQFVSAHNDEFIKGSLVLANLLIIGIKV